MLNGQEKKELSPAEMTQYSRHLLLPEVGLEGQNLLKEARVLVVGAGGLGSPVIQYLAAAGVGTIGIIDDDTVDLSNLQRQVLYKTDEVSTSKVEKAALRIKDLNPHVNVEIHHCRLGEKNALDIVNRYELIIDGSDNFSTRYLVNDACILTGKPNVHGAIYRFEGQLTVLGYKGGPCYRCIFPEPPPPDAVPNCAEGGVLGVMAGVIGTLQATEAIKIILSRGESLSGRLLVYDALEGTFLNLKIEKDENCALCGKAPTIKEVREIAGFCLPGLIPEDESKFKSKSMTALQLKNLLDSERRPVLLDVRTPQEVAICKIAGSCHIPLAELEERMNELDSAEEIVVYCKSGVRSEKAALILESAGFSKVSNLEGGIISWANSVDKNLTLY